MSKVGFSSAQKVYKVAKQAQRNVAKAAQNQKMLEEMHFDKVLINACQNPETAKILAQKNSIVPFSEQETEILQKSLFEPFIKKFSKFLGFKKTPGFHFEKEGLGNVDGYFNAAKMRVEINPNKLTDPLERLITEQGQNFKIQTPWKANLPFVAPPQIVTETRMALGEELINRALTREERIQNVLSLITHEGTHGKDVQDALMSPSVGIRRYARATAHSSAAKAEGINPKELIQEFQANWAHLKGKNHQMSKKQSCAKGIDARFEHFKKQIAIPPQNNNPLATEEAVSLYLTSPSEIRAYGAQEKFGKLLGLDFKDIKP